MLNSIKRTLKSRQVGLVQTFHLISGTASTPADLGMDKYYVSSVEDLGTGSYKITFKDKALLDIAVSGIAAATSGAIVSVAAVDKESVTIDVVDDAGAAMDADFYISCVHSTQLSSLF